MATPNEKPGSEKAPSLLGRWNAMPLYVRIVLAMVAGLATGLLLGERALIFEIPSKVILQLLGALAPPLILIAVTHVLMTTEIKGKTAGRLAGLLLSEHDRRHRDRTVRREHHAARQMVRI